MQAALAAGAVSPDRWESYRKLLGEARRHEALADAQIAQDRKRKLKQIMKAHRRFYKSQR